MESGTGKQVAGLVLFQDNQLPFFRLRGANLTYLTAFGLFAVTAMLVCYALEGRSRWFVLAFAVSCVLGSVYGFLQGAWPFGLVEGVWAMVAARRWWMDPRQL